MLVCLGTPDLITVLFFSVSWQTVYYENANAIPSLSPINLLLLLSWEFLLKLQFILKCLLKQRILAVCTTISIDC